MEEIDIYFLFQKEKESITINVMHNLEKEMKKIENENFEFQMMVNQILQLQESKPEAVIRKLDMETLFGIDEDQLKNLLQYYIEF